MANRQARGPRQIWQASAWSIKGLVAAFRLEPAFRLELYAALVLAPVALWLGRTGLERALLIGCLFAVLIVELLNSALEAVIERFGNEHHELVGRAKDMGSAAVFVAMLNVGVVWALILLPRWLQPSG